MSDVQHSLLTGASLHEPKGADAASANRVYVSDGVGSGSWAQVSLDTLSPTAKSFQGQLLHIQDQRTSGTTLSSLSSGDWRTRILNTVLTNEISGASLSSNQITLPAGTYWCEASAFISGARNHKIRLQNVTDGSTAILGLNAFSGTFAGEGATARDHAVLRGRFPIASTKTFELQHRVSTSASADANGFGVNEVFADICIWKVA